MASLPGVAGDGSRDLYNIISCYSISGLVQVVLVLLMAQ